MPRTKINKPENDFERQLLANIMYELALKGYQKSDLGRILGLSEPAVNRRVKQPRYFQVNELMMIARWCRIKVSDLFAERKAA